MWMWVTVKQHSIEIEEGDVDVGHSQAAQY